MDPAAREQWQAEVLDAILESFAASDALASCLIFKGARVLSTDFRGRLSDRF